MKRELLKRILNEVAKTEMVKNVLEDTKVIIGDGARNGMNTIKKEIEKLSKSEKPEDRKQATALKKMHGELERQMNKFFPPTTQNNKPATKIEVENTTPRAKKVEVTGATKPATKKKTVTKKKAPAKKKTAVKKNNP